MQPHEINRYLVLSSRLPHTGHAVFGPYEDMRARWADRIIFTISVIGAVLFAVGII